MAEVILDEVKEAGSDALDGFDSGQVMNYVAAWALSLLSNLKDAEEPDLDQVASDVLAEAGGFAGNEAAKQAEATKIWQVTSDHPRPSHADLDGEEVRWDEPFSNGLMYPHDPSAPVEETAGCTCLLEILPAS